MMRVGQLILSQGKKTIENKQYAILLAVVCSLLPFACWLSVAVMALVTLRKGEKAGLEVLFPAVLSHSMPLMLLVPATSALINAAVSYIPCFIAALSLRKTQNWHTVATSLFLQALITAMLIELLVPDFATEQLTQFKSMVSGYQEHEQFFAHTSDFYLAHLVLGVQIVSIAVSAVISLLIARMVQAKLFVPGGLKQELAHFRGNKAAALIGAAVLIASNHGYSLALYLLPLTLSYFLLLGVNLVYFRMQKTP